MPKSLTNPVAKKLTKRNPQTQRRTNEIIKLRLRGESCVQIAKKLDLNHSTVSKILNRDEVRAVLEAGTQQMVEMVPQVMDNYWEFLMDMDKNLKLAASRDVLKVTGLMPGQTSSFITNISENHTQNIMMQVDPRAAAALHAAIQAALQPAHDDVVADVIEK